MRPATPNPTDRAELAVAIDDCRARLDGRVGVLIGFADGPTVTDFDVAVTRNADTAYASASVIKLPVLYALYRRHDNDLNTLDEPRDIAPENRVGGAGLFHLLDSVEPSLRDLARAMVTISDNAATNELIDYLGVDAVNDAAAHLGMTDTHLSRKMMTTLDDLDGTVEDSETAETDSPANTTSPRDCARLFGALCHGNDLSAAARKEQLTILGNQKDPSMFPRYFPYETPVAHKTGWLPEAALDTGLVYWDRDRPLFFAVCCDRVDHGGDATDAIAEIGDVTFAWADEVTE